MRRVPIRLKLAAALSIPLLALGVVTVLEVVKSVNDVSEVREQTDLAVSATGPSGVITALQNERTWPGVDLVGYAGAVTVPVEGYEQTRADTDEAIRQFRDLVTAKGGAIAAAYVPVLDQLDQLEQLRAEIDANVAAMPERDITNNGDFSQHVFETYTALIDPIFDATTRISLAINDPELRQGTELADAAARQVEVISQLASAVIRDITNARRHGPGHRRRDHPRLDVRVGVHPSRRHDAQRHRRLRRHRGRGVPNPAHRRPRRRGRHRDRRGHRRGQRAARGAQHPARTRATPPTRRPSPIRSTSAASRCATRPGTARCGSWPWRSSCSGRRSC